MADVPFISIIICTYNRADYLRDTLRSLLQTDALPNQFEVLIINNNATDATPAVIREAQKTYDAFQIRHIREKKQGLSHARNRGIREATAPIVLFLDDDIRTTPNYIPAWISFFQSHPEASGGGGKIHVQFDDPRPPWMSYFLLPLLGRHDLGNSIKPYPTNKYPFGGNMAFRCEIFDRYGYFDTDLGRQGRKLIASEEKEFYHRLAASERIYYLPKAFIYHRVSKDRLTQAFIRKQALGLGHSLALQLHDAPTHKIWATGSGEIAKFIASLGLATGYSFARQYSKATMLLKFRKWIWQGYFQVKNSIQNKEA